MAWTSKQPALIRADRVRLLSLSVKTVDGGAYSYLVDCFEVDPTPLWERLAEKELVIHNAAFDLGFLTRLGFVAGKVRDTMLLAQMLAAGTMDRCSLAACCVRYLDRRLNKAEQTGDWSGVLTAAQLEYAATDVEVLTPLGNALEAKIRTAGMEQVAKIEFRCLPSLIWMAGMGVGVDSSTWRARRCPGGRRS